jgi:hypothetical protein
VEVVAVVAVVEVVAVKEVAKFVEVTKILTPAPLAILVSHNPPAPKTANILQQMTHPWILKHPH